MSKGCEIDSPLEDEVVQWWFCKCGNEYPEHLYFKSSIFIPSKVSKVNTELSDKPRTSEVQEVHEVHDVTT